MNERRIARIERQIKERLAVALVHEISDPRIGFVTISRVEMDKEMQRCKVFWSMIGDESAQRLTGKALNQAAGFLRREVAQVLHTRSVPVLSFRYDESVLGAERMRNLLEELAAERGDDPAGDPAGDPADDPADDPARDPAEDPSQTDD
jgi:ribosome-binding factor A